MPSKGATREEWLNKAVKRLNAILAEQTDLKPSQKVLISVGWPRRDRGGKVIGQCWKKGVGQGSHHIYVAPTLSTATDVLPVVLHELIHAADDCASSHKGAFRRAWKALGFIDKPTTSVPGKELKATLREVAGELGAYPHKRLYPGEEGGPPKQVSRQLKVECPACGCICRMSRAAIDDPGTPTCACGTKMEEA